MPMAACSRRWSLCRRQARPPNCRAGDGSVRDGRRAQMPEFSPDWFGTAFIVMRLVTVFRLHLGYPSGGGRLV